VERTVYRVVQEALTNAVKHAPGARAEVLLRHGSGFVAVAVQNGPPASLGAEQATASGAELLALQLKRRYGGGRPERLPSSGLGLIGLRERVALLGGEFEAGPLEDGGFRVSAWLPSDGDVLQLPGEDVRRAV
jgi:signal transduction histidine kinase